jgi:hypothetical protein
MRARVPPQDRVVVAVGSQRLGAVEAVERILEPFVRGLDGSVTAVRELARGATLADDAGVVGARSSSSPAAASSAREATSGSMRSTDRSARE